MDGTSSNGTLREQVRQLERRADSWDRQIDRMRDDNERMRQIIGELKQTVTNQAKEFEGVIEQLRSARNSGYALAGTFFVAAITIAIAATQ